MDLAGRWDLVIEEGVKFVRVFLIEESDGSAMDISSYTITMKIRPHAESATVIATTVTSPLITAAFTGDGTDGKFDITIEAAVTAVLDFTRGVYDIKITNGTTIYRILQGNVRLDREVTY